MVANTIRSLDDLDVVVDADAHVTETVEDLLPYVDESYSGAKKIITNAATPQTEIYSNTMATPGFANRAYDTRSLNDKLDELSRFGLDGGLLGPTLNLNIATIDNTQIAIALANAYNRWSLDTFLDDATNLKGNILVAPHDPERAADEIDRWAHEDGMAGVYLPDSGVVPPLGHEQYEPIYRTASKHDLPVVIHASMPATSFAFPTQRRWNETYAEEHTIAHPFTHMWNLTTMLLRGVPERYPDLTFVIQEAGIAWIPYLVWRLDDHYLEFADELPYLDRLPGKYVDEQFYFTTQPVGHTARNGEHLAWAIEMTGPESVLFSADIPHKDFDPPEALFNRIRGYFDDETTAAIMGETACELFGLEL